MAGSAAGDGCSHGQNGHAGPTVLALRVSEGDDRIVVGTTAGGLFSVSGSGGEPEALTTQKADPLAAFHPATRRPKTPRPEGADLATAAGGVRCGSFGPARQ